MQFSIIIPCYNVESYLKECLNSVCAAVQRLNKSTVHPSSFNLQPSVEIICVDDGSTDGTGKILDEYASPLSPHLVTLNVLHQSNAGVGAARNRGLEIASGEWIGFLDGDDLLSENAICIWANLIASNADVDVCVFGTEQFLDGMAWRGWSHECCSSEALDWTTSLSNRTMTFGFASRIYRRNLLRGLIFPPYRVGEDLVFLIEAMIRARKVVVTDVPLYGYRQRPGSVSLSAVSLDKVKDRVLYTMDILTALMSSRKLNVRSVAHPYLNGLVECFWAEYLRLPREDRNCAWQIWLKAIGRCRSFRRLCSTFQYARICIVYCSRSRVLAYLICYFPYWLKLQGLHR